jgi:methionyl-tRNA synthetase
MHAFPIFNTPYAAGVFVPFILAAALWTIVLKGFALWYSSRASQKWWFIALLVINTLGILEIIYLIWFRPKKDDTIAEPPMLTSSSAQ